MTIEQFKNRIQSLPAHTQDELVRAYEEKRKAFESANDEKYELIMERSELMWEVSTLKARCEFLEQQLKYERVEQDGRG